MTMRAREGTVANQMTTRARDGTVANRMTTRAREAYYHRGPGEDRQDKQMDLTQKEGTTLTELPPT